MKTTPVLLLLFFSSFITFSQSIVLEEPSKRLCDRRENELNFSINGEFPSDETFNLYFVVPSADVKIFMASSKTSPVKFTSDAPYYSLMIESSKSKIQSNIIYTSYVFNNPRINYTTTQACAGFSVALNIDSSSVVYDKIQWLKDEKEIPGANGYSYKASESGSYYVKTIQEDCLSLDSLLGRVSIKIGGLAKPDIIPYTYQPVCDEFGVDLSINSDIQNATYQWRLNGVNIANAKTSHYLTKQTGDFSVKIRQGNCEVTTDAYRAIVGELTVSIIHITPYSQLKDNVVEVCDGQEVTFNNFQYLNHKKGGNEFLEGIKYQWQRDGIDIPGANNDIYRTKETGMYRLKVTQGHCIAFSKTTSIKKVDMLKAIEFNGFKKEFCVGEEMSGNIYWNNNTVGFNLSAKIYRDNQIFKEIRPYYNFIIKESGDYHAVLSFSIPNNPKTCTLLSDTIHVTSKDNIINYSMNRPTSSSTCLDSLLVNGWAYGANYTPIHQWKLNGISIPNANKGFIMARESGIYQLETQINKGCTYLSNPVKLEFNKLDVKISKYFPTCYDSLYLHPNIYSILEFFDYSGAHIGKSAISEWQLDGRVVGHNYKQPFLTEGTYKYILKQGACVAADSIKIEASDLKVNIPTTLIPNQDSLFICPNGSVRIEAPKGNFTYTWLRNDGFFNNNETQLITTSSEGTYRVWIEKEECGRASNTIVVKEKIVLPTATISGNKEIMNGDSAKIKIDLTSLPPWTIKLTNNQEFIANKTPFEFAVKPLQTTVYELASVKNDCGVGTVSGKAEIKIIILGNEELAGAKIKLFPVPTQGICQLSVETVIPEKLGFQLFNVAGKMLMKSEESNLGNSFNEVINLESVPDGTYLLKINVGDKIVNRKIIKGN